MLFNLKELESNFNEAARTEFLAEISIATQWVEKISDGVKSVFCNDAFTNYFFYSFLKSQIISSMEPQKNIVIIIWVLGT